MSLYQIGGAPAPADELVNILGMLVGRPDATFKYGKTHWNIIIMQKDNETIRICYESESVEQDLHLRRLERYSGTIVCILGVDVSSLERFGYAELVYGEDLLVLALEPESNEKLNKFLKASYQ